MDLRRKGKIAAIEARLEICETERRQLLDLVTSTGANAALISERAERIQREFRRLRNELKVLEITDREEES
jgi:predicted transcriptional regulator